MEAAAPAAMYPNPGGVGMACIVSTSTYAYVQYVDIEAVLCLKST